jgi:LPS-assembly protein
MRLPSLFRATALAALLAICAGASADAQTAGQGLATQREREPVLFKADQLRNEQKLGLVVATGNVEFSQGQRTLLADSVTYNKRTDIVTATGNVSVLEPTGEVLFADHVELTGDLRNGIIENIRVRLTDDARIAAAGGKRSGGNRTEFAKAVYSPCKLCEEDPSRAPIWQIKAVEVIHDQTTKDIEYKDASLEFYGIPVLYTPYLSHPDPTVDRRSGFLIPTYGSDSELGALVSTPYYFDIAPDKDATLTPIVTTNEGPVLAGEFRHRLSRGEYDITGSGTYAGSDDPGSDEFRGHLKSKFRYDVNRMWRGGSDVHLATDDTYLRRYGFGSEDTLENRLFLEGFRGRNYAAANAYYFQGQRIDDDPGETPIVFPMLDYNMVGDPGIFGGQWKFDANFLTLARTSSTSSMRGSLKPRWELPYTSEGGHISRLFATVQADAYLVNDVVEPDASTNTLSGITGRIFPQAGFDWRLPMSRSAGRITQIVEPVVGVVMAPSSQNFDKIPNDDSLSVEFDENNLMSANRFPGLDRVEGGTRVSYGINTGVFGLTGGASTFFIGQSYRFTDNSDFGQGTGLEDHFSDIVGRLTVTPLRYINANFRFRLDKDDFSATRSELNATFGVPVFGIGVDYLRVAQQAIDDVADEEDAFSDREEISLSLTSKVTDRWQLGINMRRDLEDGGHSLGHAAFARYEDDCFAFQVDYARTFTRDRDVAPSDTILFRFVFKTLGEFETSENALN